MTREERITAEIARLEKALEDEEARIRAHAIAADLELSAALRLRANQRDREALIELLRAELLPAMQPARSLLLLRAKAGGGGAVGAGDTGAALHARQRR